MQTARKQTESVVSKRTRIKNHSRLDGTPPIRARNAVQASEISAKAVKMVHVRTVKGVQNLPLISCLIISIVIRHGPPWPVRACDSESNVPSSHCTPHAFWTVSLFFLRDVESCSRHLETTKTYPFKESGAGFCKAQILLQNLIFDFKTCSNYQKVT